MKSNVLRVICSISLCACNVADGELEGEEEYRLGRHFLVSMVLSRCSDKAPRSAHSHNTVHVCVR